MKTTSVSVLEPIASGIKRIWEISDIVYHGNTAYQEVLIGKTSQGLSLFCNGERQSTEETQLIYHEGQIIPALLVSKNFKRVLIIGSSEGVVTNLCLEAGAKEIVHVDIDQECVMLCAEYLPYGYTLDDIEKYKSDDKVKLLFEDGFKFIQNALDRNERFDVIVLDLPDESAELPDEQHNRLYSVDFLEDMSKLLTENGSLITQAGCSTYWRNSTLENSLKRMHQIFPTVVHFELEEQNWTWVVGTHQLIENIESHMVESLKKLPYNPNHIDELVIRKSLIIPHAIRKKLAINYK